MRLLPVLLMLVAAQACAQELVPVPGTGRWQALHFSAVEVAARGEDSYIAQVVDLAAAGKLDRDRALLQRLRSISEGLVHAPVTLNDGELATLLAHEIAHAIAEQEREYLSEALLATRHPELPLDVLQERLDTDLPLQMRLARLSAMVRFYRKLAADSVSAPLIASHPDASARISMAKGMLRLFGN